MPIESVHRGSLALMALLVIGCGQPAARRPVAVPTVVKAAPVKVEARKRPVEQFFEDIKDGKLDMSPERAALIASGVDDEKEIGMFLDRFARLKREAQEESKNYLEYLEAPLRALRDYYRSEPMKRALYDSSRLAAGMPFAKLDNLFKALYLTAFLRSKKEQGYRQESYAFSKAVTAFSTGHGTYSCLGVTLLWKLLADAMGVDARVMIGDQLESPRWGLGQMMTPAQHVFLGLDEGYYMDMAGNVEERQPRLFLRRRGKKQYRVYATVYLKPEVAVGLVEKSVYSKRFSQIRRIGIASLIAFTADATFPDCSRKEQFLSLERNEWLTHKNIAGCFGQAGDARAQKYRESALRLSKNPFTLMDMALPLYQQASEKAKRADQYLEEVIKKFPAWKGVVDTTREKNLPAAAPGRDQSAGEPKPAGQPESTR